MLRFLIILIAIYVVFQTTVALYPHSPLFRKLFMAQEFQALQAQTGFIFSFAHLKIILIRTSYLALSLYVYLLILAVFFFDWFAFKPHKPAYSLKDDHIKLTLNDGDTVVAYHWQHPSAKYTLLFSHGNAEDIEDIRPILKKIYNLGISIMAYDYPGYGLSSGKPRLKKSLLAQQQAFDYLTQQKNISPQQIILMGVSLGGGIAMQLAPKHPFAAVILESTFTSAQRVMLTIPLLPFDKLQSIHWIDKINAPLLVIHGKKDSVIPFWHGEALYNKAKEPKDFFWPDSADHNDLFILEENNYLKKIADFVKTLDESLPP